LRRAAFGPTRLEGVEPPEPAPAMTEELPKQELLIKLLKMTTSHADGEALNAMRRANALLSGAGWDWEKLVRGKIIIVEDPFAKIETPHSSNKAPPRASAPPPPAQPYRAAPQAPPRQQTPPPRPAPAAPKQPFSTKSNNYAQFCYCCGTWTVGQDGFIFNPSKHNNSAPDKWMVVCAPCNTSRPPVMRSAAPRFKTKAAPSTGPAPSLSDL
jgi:hypothetical protein